MEKPNIESRSEELKALMDVPGVDPQDIMSQLPGYKAPEPSAGGTEKPAEPEPGQPGQSTPGQKSEAGSPTEATGILKEIFGDQFTSVEDLKKINIPEKLKEAETLRQQNQTLMAEKEDLSGKLSAKPKTNFANDDLALFNEFVKTTGVKSFDVFNRLNSSDIANMDHMDAIIMARQLDNTDLIAKEPQLRKHIEKTYNVDPSQVDEDELEVNKIGLSEEGNKAKARLLELKGKLKIPEPETESTATQWTPEKETEVKTQWTAANKAMSEKLTQIPIVLPNTKTPLLNFTITKEKQAEVEAKAMKYAMSNKMEINDETIKSVAGFMYSQLILGNIDQMMHSVFEKARSMTEKEKLELYHNPAPLPGDDSQTQQGAEEDSPEARAKKAFDAEMGRM